MDAGVYAIWVRGTPVSGIFARANSTSDDDDTVALLLTRGIQVGMYTCRVQYTHAIRGRQECSTVAAMSDLMTYE